MTIESQLPEAELKIFIVGSDEQLIVRKRLIKEARTIRAALMPTYKGRVRIKCATSNVRSVLFEQIARYKPDVLHFTADGFRDPYVYLVDDHRIRRRLTGARVARECERVDLRIPCIFFSNCRPYRTVRALGSHVSYSIYAYSRHKHFDKPQQITAAFYEGLGKTRDWNLAQMDFSENLYRTFPKAIIKLAVVKSEVPAQLAANASIQGELDDDFAAVMSRIGQSLGSGINGLAMILAAGKDALERSSQTIEKVDGSFLYKVWFGTNRISSGYNASGICFGSERAEHVTYGYCTVSIPKTHKIGEVGNPWWARFPKFWEDDRLAIRECVERGDEDYWRPCHPHVPLTT